jgi:transposase
MQSPSAVLNIGADVAKDAIVVACSEGSFAVREVANQRPAVLAFLKGLLAGSRIGVESTGIYHELCTETAHELGFLVFLLNPQEPATTPRPLDCGARPIAWMPSSSRA